MLRVALCAAFASVVGLGSAAGAETRTFPYTTKVTAGDFDAAHLAYGDRAAAGIPGRDAIPMFTSVRAYDRYYGDDKACDGNDSCIHSLYAALRSEGAISLVSVGETVTVLGFASGSED
jgi:hypothetical protein